MEKKRRRRRRKRPTLEITSKYVTFLMNPHGHGGWKSEGNKGRRSKFFHLLTTFFRSFPLGRTRLTWCARKYRRLSSHFFRRYLSYLLATRNDVDMYIYIYIYRLRSDKVEGSSKSISFQNQRRLLFSTRAFTLLFLFFFFFFFLSNFQRAFFEATSKVKRSVGTRPPLSDEAPPS